MARILVTDAHTRTALAATRSLGRGGHQVFVTGTRLPALASVSRYCSASAVIPDARADAGAAAAALLPLVERWGIDVVLPTTDIASVLVMQHYGERVGRAVVAAPSRAAYELMSDKAALLPLAERAGLRIPRSELVHSAVELAAAAGRIGLPCIVKPHRSVVLADGQAHGRGVLRLRSPDDLATALPAETFPALVQEYIPGHGAGVFLLVDGPRVIASFAHRRMREKPPEGGVSTYREAALPDPDLVARGARLLADAGWRGAAMIEFRRPPTGEPAVMEVNGRLWGSLQLAIDAGVDYPMLLVALFLGEEVQPVRSYRAGVRSRWEWGDLDHLLKRTRWLFTGAPPHSLPGYPRLLWDFVTGILRPDDRLEVLRLSDWRPFVRESLDWLQGRGS